MELKYFELSNLLRKAADRTGNEVTVHCYAGGPFELEITCSKLEDAPGYGYYIFFMGDDGVVDSTMGINGLSNTLKDAFSSMGLSRDLLNYIEIEESELNKLPQREAVRQIENVFRGRVRNARIRESKRQPKRKLKEGMGGCYYVIHESPIGFRAYQGWIDAYSEVTSDIASAEHYDTLQTAVNMLYAIEDYVENFNDNQGIRATIQCVNPDDPNQVLEDIAVVDVQKRWGVVDCQPVSGEQNLINCGYWIEDSEPSMGYNL